MSVEPSTFKALMGRFASGVTVVTLVDAEGDLGMTASAFSSVSLSPPLVLVCVGRGARMHERLAARGLFAVNLLAEEQESVSNRFAGWWEEGRSKWADLEIEPGPVSGAAWIGGALASFDCRLHAAHDGGDHTIYVGEVLAARLSPAPREELRPLVYFAGGYRQLR